MPASSFPNFGVSMLKLLEENGLHLDAEQQKTFIPDLEQRFNQRLALELLPQLSDEQRTQFAQMLDNPATTENLWQDFWSKAIPDVGAEIERISAGFAADVTQLLAETA